MMLEAFLFLSRDLLKIHLCAIGLHLLLMAILVLRQNAIVHRLDRLSNEDRPTGSPRAARLDDDGQLMSIPMRRPVVSTETGDRL